MNQDRINLINFNDCDGFDEYDNFDDYNLLRLLSALILLNGGSPIIEKNKLEKALGDFQCDPYLSLFKESNVKFIHGEAQVDLTIAFNNAYQIGLLAKMPNSEETRSIINLSINEADKIKGKYTCERVKLMNNLCREILDSKVLEEEDIFVRSRK